MKSLDLNGLEIYAGDRVQVGLRFGKVIYTPPCNLNRDDGMYLVPVEYDDGTFRYELPHQVEIVR